MKGETRPRTLFCSQNYAPDRLYFEIANHLVTCLLLLALAWFIVMYYRKRNHFPVKQRSSRLSLIQLLGFYFLFLEQYLVELYLLTSEDWTSEDLHDVPIMRRLFKSVYLAARVVSYLTFLFRVILIYTAWKPRKIDEEELKRRLKNKRRIDIRKLFEDETLVLRFLACLFLGILVVGFVFSEAYITDIESFDWYDPTYSFFYKTGNFTYVRIAENIILILCSYIHRYPPLTQELPSRTTRHQGNQLCPLFQLVSQLLL